MGRDPRRNKNEPPSTKNADLDKSQKVASFLTKEDLNKLKGNQDYFRQNEAII